MFNQHYKHKNIKFKHTKLLKQLSSALLATVLIVTSLPISTVHADGVRTFTINSGASTQHGTPSSADSAKFGGFKNEGVRAYIYNKQSGKFIESETEQYRGIKAFDFLGFDGVYEFVENNVKAEDKSYTTAFGSLDSDEVKPVNAWPFEKDGTQYYFANYELNGTNMAGESYYNTTISGTPWTDDMLKENNGQVLHDIIQLYWGEAVDSEFQRSENLMFIVEPIFIVSEAFGDASEDKSGWSKSFKCKTQEYDVTKFGVIIIIEEEENSCLENALKGASKQTVSVWGSDGEIHEADYKCCSKEEFYNDWYEFLDAETRDMVDFEKSYNAIDHIEVIYWKETEERTLYRQYKYTYGTARELEERWEKDDENRPEFASNYAIMASACDAVYTAEVGENGEYNDSYDLIFTSNVNSDNKHSCPKPQYEGKGKRLYGNDGVTKTTWGIYMLSSMEFGDCIWHTNAYLKNKPSGVPRAAAPGGPNESLTYGNNTVVKVYETRDRNTGKLIESKSFCSALDTDYGSGIPDTICIEDELKDKWVSEKVDVLETEVDRTWVKWMKNNNNIENLNEIENPKTLDEIENPNPDEELKPLEVDDGKVKALGSGYIVEDWCTGSRSLAEAYNLSALDNDTNGGYAYETKDLTKFNQGKGEAFVTLGGSGENGGAVDENILYVRLVKYTDGSQETLDINNIYGEVWLLKSDNINFPAESTSKELVLERCLRNNYGR